jgi:hypothetical protein
VFVVAASPGAAGLVHLDELVFADAQRFLNSPAAVLDFFAAMLVGGTTLVWLKGRITMRLEGRK